MRALNSIPKINPEPVADPAWEIVGTHHKLGKPIYRERIPMTKPVPKFDKDGKRSMRKHATTGEELYPLNRPERFELVRDFYLESDGQANLYKVFYKQPTPEEIEAQRRREAAKDILPDLAEALLASGLTPAELVAKLRAAPAVASPVPEPESPTGDVKDESDVEYPVMYAPGRWELSDGTKMQGKREEAEEREAALQAARAEAIMNAALTPDY